MKKIKSLFQRPTGKPPRDFYIFRDETHARASTGALENGGGTGATAGGRGERAPKGRVRGVGR